MDGAFNCRFVQFVNIFVVETVGAIIGDNLLKLDAVTRLPE